VLDFGIEDVNYVFVDQVLGGNIWLFSTGEKEPKSLSLIHHFPYASKKRLQEMTRTSFQT
jgi:hypothetical protein